MGARFCLGPCLTCGGEASTSVGLENAPYCKPHALEEKRRRRPLESFDLAKAHHRRQARQLGYDVPLMPSGGWDTGKHATGPKVGAKFSCGECGRVGHTAPRCPDRDSITRCRLPYCGALLLPREVAAHVCQRVTVMDLAVSRPGAGY